MTLKTIYSACFALIISISTFAQDTEGMQGKFDKKDIPVHARRQMYGINGFYDSDKIEINGDDFTRKQYGFDLLSGYFIADKWVLGGKFGWNVNETLLSGDDFQGEKVLYGGIFSRYYLMLGDSYFAVFPEVTIGYAGVTFDTQKSQGPIVQAGAGVTHFLSPNVGLEFVAFYEHLTAKGDMDLAFSNVAMRIGFQVYLPYESKPDPRGYY